MRNRRAAQESRDRKKRQFEALEDENRRLQQENAEMKRRIEQLEAQHKYNLIFDPSITTPPPAPTPTENESDEPIVKTEVFSPESFDTTFHPAVMESDQQCQSISVVNSLLVSLMMILHLPWWQRIQLRLFSTLFSLMTKTWISLLNGETPVYLFPATFNSLNTGSLFTGAENGLCGFSGRLVRSEVVGMGKEVVDRLGKAGLRLDWLSM
jgi:hypothetical protein